MSVSVCSRLRRPGCAYLWELACHVKASMPVTPRRAGFPYFCITEGTPSRAYLSLCARSGCVSFGMHVCIYRCVLVCVTMTSSLMG